MHKSDPGTTRTIIITILSFLFYFFLNGYFSEIYKALHPLIRFHLLSYFITYVIIGMPILIGTILIHRDKEIPRHLGLNQGLLHKVIRITRLPD